MGSWRVWRIVLIVVVILGGLLYGADWIAVGVAQSKVAERVQRSEGLSEKPKVTFDHFPAPFLTQVLFGSLDHVSVEAKDINAGGGDQSVRITRFTADLYGVDFSDSYTKAVADHADGKAFITYADLSNAAPHGITVSAADPAADGTARVKLTGRIPGVGVKVSVFSTIKVKATDSGEADTIVLHAESLPKEIVALGLEDKAREQIDFQATLDHLPANIALTRVVGQDDGITVEAAGKGVELTS
jgi:hypothetical protein